MNVIEIRPTLFEYVISDRIDGTPTVSKEKAEKLMKYFADAAIFNWADNNNGCEARADAVCLLLAERNIPHFKAWVFSGLYLKKHIGGLKQNWNYHVAALLPVEEGSQISYYVIDPSTSAGLQTLENWAANITHYPHSYHLIKEPHWYIFSENTITRNNWYRRNRQNRKWMIQGLAGINSLTTIGKAALVFNKNRIRNKKIALRKLQNLQKTLVED